MVRFNSAPAALLATVLVTTACSTTGPSKAGVTDTLAQNNRYTAPRAVVAPTIDGDIDDVWAAAAWQAMDVLWLGAQQTYPSPEDYSGRFKILWDAGQLYLLFEIIDDTLYDHARAPFEQFWIDDTIELFIDEDNSGGPHHERDSANAWAYHLSIYKDNVDNVDGQPVLLNDHVNLALTSSGDRHIWEMSVRVYADDYDFRPGAANRPVALTEDKVLGFSAAYIDNDNSLAESAVERESMMGSVDSQGHKDNLGYLNADVLGELVLVEKLH